MSRFYNVPELKEFRRQLRNDRSPAEHVIWRYLKRRQFLGLKFRRQHSIGKYVVDFYCPAKHVVVEIDGDSHFSDDGQRHDTIRTNFLHGLGIRVFRFRNDEVLVDPEGVMERLQTLMTTPYPSSPEEGAD